jgi:hypothetical protein
MQKNIFFLISFTLMMSSSLYSQNPPPAQNEEDREEQVAEQVADIDRLIKATQDAIEKQKNVRNLLENYRKIESNCLQNSSDPDLLFKLADAGKLLFNAIEESGLKDYFKPEFIVELKKLKDISEKRTIPPAR